MSCLLDLLVPPLLGFNVILLDDHDKTFTINNTGCIQKYTEDHFRGGKDLNRTSKFGLNYIHKANSNFFATPEQKIVLI